ncbi:protein preY, mitochondrial isoform X1 [Athene noctua]|uniref:protein preY, mitochondrial isoform X1 n=1 Tax=Athene noctua TaxID=126797 RepID=UPI003EC01B01
MAPRGKESGERNRCARTAARPGPVWRAHRRRRGPRRTEGAAMLRGAAALLLRRAASGGQGQGQGQGQHPCQGQGSARPQPLEPSLLRFLVCPLSKRPLRYEEATNELINEELGIAYPIIDGIPNMVPEAARTTQKKPPAEGSKQP